MQSNEPTALGPNYLQSELIAGLLYAEIAVNAGDDLERRERNRAAAEKAYAAYCRCLLRVQLSLGELKDLEADAERLRVALESIPRE